MQSTTFLTLFFLCLAMPGFSEEPGNRRMGTALVGVDAGVSGFTEHGNAHFALNVGYLERRGNYLGGQIGFSHGMLLPEFWEQLPKPSETRFTANLLLGRDFLDGRPYLKAAGGIGFIREVRRGKPISFDPVYTHEKKVDLGLCFPLELSFGYLYQLGAGLKLNGLIGRDSRAGVLVEFLLEARNHRQPH